MTGTAEIKDGVLFVREDNSYGDKPQYRATAKEYECDSYKYSYDLWQEAEQSRRVWKVNEAEYQVSPLTKSIFLPNDYHPIDLGGFPTKIKEDNHLQFDVENDLAINLVLL